MAKHFDTVSDIGQIRFCTGENSFSISNGFGDGYNTVTLIKDKGELPLRFLEMSGSFEGEFSLCYSDCSNDNIVYKFPKGRYLFYTTNWWRVEEEASEDDLFSDLYIEKMPNF